MEEKTTVEKRTTVIPDPAQPASTNINIDQTGDAQVQRNEPGGTTVRETTVEERTRRG